MKIRDKQIPHNHFWNRKNFRPKSQKKIFFYKKIFKNLQKLEKVFDTIFCKILKNHYARQKGPKTTNTCKIRVFRIFAFLTFLTIFKKTVFWPFWPKKVNFGKIAKCPFSLEIQSFLKRISAFSMKIRDKQIPHNHFWNRKIFRPKSQKKIF
ncbi:unnamed protein product, partial [Trypanosoma congolense IL3000]